MTQLRRSLEALLTAIALTAAVATQPMAEDSFKQLISSLDTTVCYAESGGCSPKIASTWQFLKLF